MGNKLLYLNKFDARRVPEAERAKHLAHEIEELILNGGRVQDFLDSSRCLEIKGVWIVRWAFPARASVPSATVHFPWGETASFYLLALQYETSGRVRGIVWGGRDLGYEDGPLYVVDVTPDAVARDGRPRVC